MRTFQLFYICCLLCKIKKTCQISQAPIFKIIESYSEIIEMDSDWNKISNEFIETIFSLGKNYVLSQVEYIKSIKKINSWTISTQKMIIRRNSILKKGTNAYKMLLGPSKSYNELHKEKRKFSKANSASSKKLRVDIAMNYLSSKSGDKNEILNLS